MIAEDDLVTQHGTTTPSGHDYFLLFEFESEGTTTFSVPAGVAQDESKNPNTACEPITVTYDGTVPEVIAHSTTTRADGLEVKFSVSDATALGLPSDWESLLTVIPSDAPVSIELPPTCNATTTGWDCTVIVSYTDLSNNPSYTLVLMKDAFIDLAGNGNPQTTVAGVNMIDPAANEGSDDGVSRTFIIGIASGLALMLCLVVVLMLRRKIPAPTSTPVVRYPIVRNPMYDGTPADLEAF